jgi:hypothetical protein
MSVGVASLGVRAGATSGRLSFVGTRGTLLFALESLAAALVERRWAQRAALVSDRGEVLTLRVARPPSGPQVASEPEASGGTEPTSGAVIARLVVAGLGEQRWLYADLGTIRLVALLAGSGQPATVTGWLAGQLRRLGVTVERAPLAQD